MIMHVPLLRMSTLFRRAGLALFCLAITAAGAGAQPLRLGYSDWPGYVAWQVAIEKNWFKEAGLDVEFQWFDYSASLDAYAAGKLDGVAATNGDMLVTGGNGAKSVMITLLDFSNGNDMIVGRPGIHSLKDLKGQKVGVEIGLVEHLLLLNGLKKLGMTDADVTLVNTKTNETPQVLASGDVAAIGAWQPNSGMAIRQVPGARPIYTSADEPGLIYDVLAVNPALIASHKEDFKKLTAIWYRCVSYITDPATVDDAVRMMAARTGLTPEAYKPLLKGTHLLNLAEGKKAFVKGPGFDSLYGSSTIADAFNVQYNVYKDHQNIDSYIDPAFTEAQ
jgi:NitT/TauT family transport system substrate-binding protein